MTQPAQPGMISMALIFVLGLFLDFVEITVILLPLIVPFVIVRLALAPPL